MIAAPESEPTTYLRVLATVAAMLKGSELRGLRQANSGEEVISCFQTNTR